MRRERLAGAALAAAGLLFALAATLTPIPGQPYSVPASCIICGDFGGVDAFNNVLLFLPLGAGLTLAGVRRWLVVVLALLLTCTVELLQVAVVTGRDANIGDVLANTVGAVLGVALAASWRRWLLPAPAMAWRLAALAALAWLAVIGGTGWALQREAPVGAYTAQVVPIQVDGYSEYRGRTLAATLNGLPLRPGPLTDASAVRAAVLADRVALDAEVTTGSMPRRLAPVAIVWGQRPGELLALGQRRHDAVFRIRQRAARARLRSPAAVIPDGFPVVPLTARPDLAPTDTMRVRGGVRDRALYVAATLRGRMQRREVPLAPSLGWTFFLPFEYRFGGELPLLSALWLGGLLVPFGYWARRGTAGASDEARRGERATWAAAAALLVAGLLLLPALWALHPARWWEWGAAAAGVALGWHAGRWSVERRAVA